MPRQDTPLEAGNGPRIQAPIPADQARITHVREFAYIFRANLLGPLLPEAKEQLLAEVSEEARSLLRQAPTPEEWVSAEVMAEIRLAYRRLFHMEAAQVRGTLMVEHMMQRGRLGSIQTSVTPAQFLSAVVAIFPSTHRGGLAVLDCAEPGREQMSIWGQFPYPQYLGIVVPEILRRGLTQLGHARIKVDYAGPKLTGHPYWNRYRII